MSGCSFLIPFSTIYYRPTHPTLPTSSHEFSLCDPNDPNDPNDPDNPDDLNNSPYDSNPHTPFFPLSPHDLITTYQEQGLLVSLKWHSCW